MQQHKYTNIFTMVPSAVSGTLQLTAYCVQLYTLVHILCCAKYDSHDAGHWGISARDKPEERKIRSDNFYLRGRRHYCKHLYNGECYYWRLLSCWVNYAFPTAVSNACIDPRVTDVRFIRMQHSMYICKPVYCSNSTPAIPYSPRSRLHQ